MIISPKERVRLILAAAEAYEPHLLITAGHAVGTRKHLRDLVKGYKKLGLEGGIVTELHHDGEDERDDETHAMYAVSSTGRVHRFGPQVFAFHKDVPNEFAPDLAKFVEQLPQRKKKIAGYTVFALICGEINLLRAGKQPRFLSPTAERAIMAADVVINPTHDRMGRSHILKMKREMLSRPGDGGRNRVAVSCSNWETCSKETGRAQIPNEELQTVYVSGKPVAGEELADGSFGFIYRRWELDLDRNVRLRSLQLAFNRVESGYKSGQRSAISQITQ